MTSEQPNTSGISLKEIGEQVAILTGVSSVEAIAGIEKVIQAFSQTTDEEVLRKLEDLGVERPEL